MFKFFNNRKSMFKLQKFCVIEKGVEKRFKVSKSRTTFLYKQIFHPGIWRVLHTAKWIDVDWNRKKLHT